MMITLDDENDENLGVKATLWSLVGLPFYTPDSLLLKILMLMLMETEFPHKQILICDDFGETDHA